MLLGSVVRQLKESIFFNDLYRIYTEYKTSRNYRNYKMSSVFEDICVENKWGGTESVSGVGSDLVQTKKIIEDIPKLLNTFKITTFLDLPCGDHFWMKEVHLENIDYIGCDIVPSLIERNSQLYSNKSKQFKVIDLTQDNLPDADLILVRDCFVHLSFEKINDALINLKKSRIKYLLTTTFPFTKRNYDITTGNWRPLNLTKQPFNFPPPTTQILEKCTESYGQYKDKSLWLWEINKLPDRLSL